MTNDHQALNPDDCLVHAIQSTYGDLQRITLDDSEADMASREGHTVSVNVPLTDVLDDVIFSGPPLNIMDDATWRGIRDKITQPVINDNAISPLNPPDLPVVLANYRLNLVLRYWRPENLQSYVELSEIIMAGHNRREPDPRVFSADAKDVTFKSWFETSYEDLEEHLEITEIRAAEVSAENASERAAFGDSAPGSAINEALTELTIREMRYALNNWQGAPKRAAQQHQEPDDEPWQDIAY